jgi:hypothetical protein
MILGAEFKTMKFENFRQAVFDTRFLKSGTSAS